MSGGIERRIIVAIEASTPASGVALADVDGRLLAQAWGDSPVPASERLLADLDRLLREFSIKHESIGAVAVALGPGAFTGLRVGLAEAKTMADAWGARLYGISTLAAMARRWPVAGDVVCAALDARRGEVYSGVYALGEDVELKGLGEDRVSGVGEWLEGLRAMPSSRILFSGSGARKYREDVMRALGDRAAWVRAPWDNPAPDSLALLGAAALRRGEAGVDPLAVGPVYLRASDAEKRHPHGVIL